MTTRRAMYWSRCAGLWFAVLAGAATSLSAPSQPPAAGADARPDFAVVEQAVRGYFGSLPDHRPNDLVSRSGVEAALASVAEAGWDVPQRDDVLNRALGDGSFLVRELATPAGRKFMREIARHQGAYSRLDRLSSLSRGEHTVRQLVRDKGGYELIEYLATTSGGRNLGRMMAGSKQGVDLNKPTDRIYTAEDLVAALKALYVETGP